MKKNKVIGISTGEVSVIDFFNRLYNCQFVKVRPDWLKNPKTGCNLELDGFNEKLKIAIEYGSHLQVHTNSLFFKDAEYVKYKDNLKVKLCKKNGVYLIKIPDLRISDKNIDQQFKKIVRKEFQRLKLQIPRGFNKIKLEIKDTPGMYSKQEVWAIAIKCNNRSEFEDQNKGYWRASERLGINKQIVNYFRKKMIRKNPHYFIKKDRGSVWKMAKLCKSKTEFCRKYPAFYKWAVKNNCLDQVCSHMKERQKPSGYWKKSDNIIKELKFMKMQGKQYSDFPCMLRTSINRLGMKNEYYKMFNVKLMDNFDSDLPLSIKKAREYGSLSSLSKNNHRLYRWVKKKKFEFKVFPELLETKYMYKDKDFVVSKVRKMESFCEDKVAIKNLINYKEDNFKNLKHLFENNFNKTYISLEDCRINVLKYKTMKQINFYCSYEVEKLKRFNRWMQIEQKIKNNVKIVSVESALDLAKKSKSRTDFGRKYRREFKILKENGLLMNAFSHLPSKKMWNIDIAKKIIGHYEELELFRKENLTLYRWIIRHKNQGLMSSLIVKYPPIKHEDAIKIGGTMTKTQLYEKEHRIYQYLKKHGLLDKICILKRNDYWTKESAFLIARKYNNITLFRKNENACCLWLSRRGLYDDATKHMNYSRENWSKFPKKAISEASNYKNLTELSRKRPGLYNFIRVRKLANKVWPKIYK